MDIPLVEFQAVDYTYPAVNRPTIHNLNLIVPRHRRTALIGQNGCGKTTFFALCQGLYQPQAGQIYWQGQPSNSKTRQKIGLLFQNPEQQIIANTVIEDLAYGLVNRGLPPQQIQHLVGQCLREFQLVDLADKPVHHLSLGQKKLVSLAGVMILQPDLLLLDEPTAYLDQLHTQQFLRALRRVYAAQTTIVLATHDLNLVYRWADWVLVMHQGQIVLAGTPEQVFRQRQLLEELNLGVPLFVELLDWIEAESGTTQGQLQQRIWQMFRYL